MSMITHSLCQSNFDKICRICLITTESSSTSSFKELLDKLQYCIGIKLEEDATLPGAFCGNCANTINIMYNFKELCIYSQQILSDILRNELANVKTEPINTINDENPVPPEVLEIDNKLSVTAAPLDPLDIKKENINNSSLPTIVTNANTIPILKTNKPKTSLVKKPVRRREIFECQKYWCNKYFRSARKRDDHMRRHLPKEQRYQRCTNCNRSYINKKYLIKHQKKHYIKEQCDICGATVPCLKRHLILKHSDIKPYQCNQCTSKFVREDYLRGHIRRVHDGKKERAYLCEECGKIVRQQSHFRDHLNHHTGEKPHKCLKCPYTSRSRPGLTKHFNIHHNENRVKKFVCTLCDKKFDDNTSLQSHIRSHTGERPYVCKLCDKRYTQRASLKLHFKSHQLAVPLKTEMVKS